MLNIFILSTFFSFVLIAILSYRLDKSKKATNEALTVQSFQTDIIDSQERIILKLEQRITFAESCTRHSVNEFNKLTDIYDDLKNEYDKIRIENIYQIKDYSQGREGNV